MYTTAIAGLIALVVACFLCGLLMFLYTRLRACCRQLSTQQQHPPPVPLKDFYTPATLSSLQHSARACTAATTTNPRNSQQHAWPIVAKQNVPSSPLGMVQCAEVLAVVNPARLESSCPTDLSSETLVGHHSPLEIKCNGIGRFSLDLESAWPQPLQPARTKQKYFPEQLWRNSSGGSSFYSQPSSWCSSGGSGFYSRPSSWCSISDTERVEENIKHWPRASLGMIVDQEPTPARISRLLPALPTRKKHSSTTDIVQVAWI